MLEEEIQLDGNVEEVNNSSTAVEMINDENEGSTEFVNCDDVATENSSITASSTDPFDCSININKLKKFRSKIREQNKQIKKLIEENNRLKSFNLKLQEIINKTNKDGNIPEKVSLSIHLVKYIN